MTLEDRFKKKSFITTVELPPPRGVDTVSILNLAEKIIGKVDAVNVTDNQRSLMRMSSLAFSHLLKEKGLTPIMQVCCRDKNRLALQSELLGAWALGIKNICAMTGDHPVMGDHPSAKPVFDLDSIQLIEMIETLRKGESLAGKRLNGVPDFYVGGVINPFAEPFDLHLIKLKKKVDAGACFFQTQPFFDVESVEQFLERVSGIDAGFLIGIVPLKSVKMIEFMNAKVLSKPISDTITERLKQADDPTKEGISITIDFINRIKNMVSGLHIMPIGLELHLPEILDKIN